MFVLCFAYKDSRLTWYAKIITACVVAYSFSLMALIPDFIPVLGYVDDLILIPLRIFLALKLIPKPAYKIINQKQEAEKLGGGSRVTAPSAHLPGIFA